MSGRLTYANLRNREGEKCKTAAAPDGYSRSAPLDGERRARGSLKQPLFARRADLHGARKAEPRALRGDVRVLSFLSIRFLIIVLLLIFLLLIRVR